MGFQSLRNCKIILICCFNPISFLVIIYTVTTNCVYLSTHVQLFATPWTVAHQAPLSMGFSRQEYWSGLPCSPPGDLPNPGLNPGLMHCRWILYLLSPVFYWASQVVLVEENQPANAGDTGDVGLIPGSGRSPGKGNGNPLQYSCLENSMDREA